MLRTPLHEAHRDSGALFGEVDGWEMPKAFGDLGAEYAAAAEGAAIADRSHHGRLRATGTKRLDLLHRITTNHVEDLAHGEGAETILCTNEGRIVDRLFVHAGADHYVMVTSPNMAAAVKAAIEKVRFRDDVTIEDVTATTAMISLLGPEADRIAEEIARASLTGLKPCHWRRVEIGGVPVMAVRSAGVGGGGFDLIVDAPSAADVWRAILREGAAAGARPMGSEAYEILRVEWGVPAQGRELTEEFNPLEARLDAAIHWSKGRCTGQEVIARLGDRNEIQRLLVGYIVEAGAVPEPRSRVFARGIEIGVLTSVVPSLTMRRAIALGYIRRGHEAPGTRVAIHSSGAVLGAEVSALPFARQDASRH